MFSQLAQETGLGILIEQKELNTPVLMAHTNSIKLIKVPNLSYVESLF